MREEAKMKDHPMKEENILMFKRFDHDDYKKAYQSIEKTDDCGRIGRTACELQERLYTNGQRQGRDDQEGDVRCESAGR